MERKHSIGMRLIEILVALPIVLVICVVSAPAIMYIGVKYLMYKIK
jgi:hypothetical protein